MIPWNAKNCFQVWLFREHEFTDPSKPIDYHWNRGVFFQIKAWAQHFNVHTHSCITWTYLWPVSRFDSIVLCVWQSFVIQQCRAQKIVLISWQKYAFNLRLLLDYYTHKKRTWGNTLIVLNHKRSLDKVLKNKMLISSSSWVEKE